MADIGTVLGGRYRLIELLGQGGMATIYRARDSQLERDVAVKVLRPEYGADPDFNERFRHEAQSAASLNHPGIVSVFDYGTDPAGPFIVMELVDGEDLATILRRSGALPARQAARLVAQAARAIAAAHDHGFVHRDVKPGNILVTREGRVKVTDFGIARAMAESALTLPGTTLGSVHYFSPEQARGEPATTASDVYSLGIVLYELLTGRRPWEGDTAAAIATARLTGPVPSPSAVRAGIPPTLEAIDRKALAPQPEDRFGSAAEMAVALERYLAEDRPAAASGPAAAAAGGVAGAGGGVAGAAALGAAGLGLAGAGVAGSAAAAAGGAAPGAPTAGALTGAPTLAGPASSPGGVGAGVARPNPGQIPYRPDDYADAPPGGGRPPQAGSGGDDAGDDRGGGGSAWLWLSALLALGVLALAGFLVFKLVNSPATPPPPASSQVIVPNFVGLTYDQARSSATDHQLQVSAAFATSDQAVNTVLSQTPAAGTAVDPGSTVSLSVAGGPDTVIVPDLRGKTESDALNMIFSTGLGIGARSETYDPTVPPGSIVSQNPAPGIVVTKGLLVDYVVSKGPQPTPSPTPTPTPVPTPVPTPTPTPVPPPTPPPPTASPGPT